MGAPIDVIQNWTEIKADMVIDVRSPAEFAEDHIPGAINMPVLNNEERAEVGTIYKQKNSFQARRYGGALVAKNISQHILTGLGNRPVEFRPLIYCWRGGQRSVSFARICSDIGWRTYVLEGGYKSYRRNVLIALEAHTPKIKPILISGPTGKLEKLEINFWSIHFLTGQSHFANIYILSHVAITLPLLNIIKDR